MDIFRGLGKKVRFFQGLAVGRNKHFLTGSLLMALCLVLVFYLMSPVAKAATKINDAGNPGGLTSAGRQLVRASNGDLYSFINVGTSCEIWKSTDGTSWTEQDAANRPICDASEAVAMAIDSADTLHLAYFATDAVKYRTFASGSFGIEETPTACLGVAPAAHSLDIAVDSANKPHLIRTTLASGGSGTTVLCYSNRTTGSWTNPAVQIGTASGNQGYYGVSLTINEDNIPEFSSIRNQITLIAGVGDANNASTFTQNTAIDSHPNIVDNTSIAIDSAGNTWVGYLSDNGSTGVISLVKHNDLDVWSSWQARVTNSNPGVSASVVANGTDIYVFYQDDLNDIVYDKYSGSWQGERVLQAGTYQDAKAMWSNYNANQATNQINYLFSDGVDVYWDKLTLNSSPLAPVLSSPADGTTITGTTQTFQVTGSDPNSDNIKYHIKIFNGTSQSGGNCSGTVFEEQDQNSSQGGWSQAGSYTSGATASYTSQAALTRGNSYCWQVRAIDPTGNNSFGSWSIPSTFTVNSTPVKPVLITPSISQTALSALPQFLLRTTDADSDYLQYHLKIYASAVNTECEADSATNLIRSIDQSSPPQTGWQQQNQQSGSAYSSGPSIANSIVAVYQYQAPPLAPNTTYWWKARAIDPGGSNTWGNWATCTSFGSSASEVQVRGGTDIRGGTTIQ